ncbi:hypothetical protein LLCRE1631_00343 [Lactococcus lactis subsp. lactis CNCM I-1631]|nr:hypothetical protein LLCRE1631_00343 [Lactococcus lactis subsp. lactis CNCM I-1631]
MYIIMDFKTMLSYLVSQDDEISLRNDIKHEEVYKILENKFASIMPKFKTKGYKFKDTTEVLTFAKFVFLLQEWGLKDIQFYKNTNSFLFGYIIPQINKEFDLLRFGENYNISIELKSKTTVEAQKQQLCKNYFYLNFLSTKTRYISISPDISSYIEYIPSENKYINLSGTEICDIIIKQEFLEYNTKEVDSFFDIKNYLVSPFNDVEKFLDDKYFLTPHQDQIVKEITEPSDKKTFGIKGNPGTGKSLLVYHICKKLMEKNKRVAIVHGANLNNGQQRLALRGFTIFPVKSIIEVLDNADKYDYIVVDEAQRLRQDLGEQYTKLVDTIENSQTKFIISLDGRQTLNKYEIEENSIKLFKYIKNKGVTFSLKDKFRTNPEMSKFIQLLFKIPMYKKIDLISNIDHNIIIKYFDNRESGNEYISDMDSNSDWEVLNYTKDRFRKTGIGKMCGNGLTSHSIIGQEFDKVIIPLDSNFFYKEQKIIDSKTGESKVFKLLETTDNFYPLEKMLYQNLTRTRGKIEFVIIGNRSIFNEICGLLDSL